MISIGNIGLITGTITIDPLWSMTTTEKKSIAADSGDEERTRGDAQISQLRIISGVVLRNVGTTLGCSPSDPRSGVSPGVCLARADQIF